MVIAFWFAFVSSLWAAESWTVTSYGQANQGAMFVIKAIAQSGTTGLYTANRVITAAEAGFDYHRAGYCLLHAYAINDGTSYPNQAATVSIHDATGLQLVGSSAGDTLTLSTSAGSLLDGTGTAQLSAARSAGQRPVNSLINLTIADTQSGSATSIVTIYLVFAR